MSRTYWEWDGALHGILGTTFEVDNSAFELSGEAGRSRVERLNSVLQRLFLLQLEYTFVIRYQWISTVDNELADHLSRGRIAAFYAAIALAAYGFFKAGRAVVIKMAEASGRALGMDPTVREYKRWSIQAAAAGLLKHKQPRVDMFELSRQIAAAVDIQAAARGMLVRTTRFVRVYGGANVADQVSRLPRQQHAGFGRPRKSRIRLLFMLMCVCGTVAAPNSRAGSSADPATAGARTDLYTGLPGSLPEWLDGIMDTRLAASSMRTVSRAVDLWDQVRSTFGWEQLIRTDDPERGAKLVTFVRHLAEDIWLPWVTIAAYLWGLCTWCMLQRQTDPRVGVIGLKEFLKAMSRVCACVGEPRRQVPKEVLVAILETTDPHDFVQVQLGFILLLYFLSFPRAEHFPKNHTGEESFDPMKHWLVRDFTVRSFPFGYLFGARSKIVKTDQRLERDGIHGDGYYWGDAAEVGGYDFTWIGDVPGTIFSIFNWYRRYLTFFSGPRPPTGFMFLDPDRVRPLTYRVLLKQFQDALQRPGVDYDGPPLGLHGIRVLGYNESKRANGEDITAAQGIWLGPKSSGHGRYARFPMLDVANMASRMVSGEEGDVYSAPASTRQIRRRSAPAMQPSANELEPEERIPVGDVGPDSEVLRDGTPRESVEVQEGVELAAPIAVASPVEVLPRDAVRVVQREGVVELVDLTTDSPVLQAFISPMHVSQRTRSRASATPHPRSGGDANGSPAPARGRGRSGRGGRGRGRTSSA